jgi:hypothetical protein
MDYKGAQAAVARFFGSSGEIVISSPAGGHAYGTTRVRTDQGLLPLRKSLVVPPFWAVAGGLSSYQVITFVEYWKS